MEPEEWEDEWEAGSCAQCGAAIGSVGERSDAFGAGNQLCWTCALVRGGSCDADRDVWERSPDLSGLHDEAYGASPREVHRGGRRG
jgi:hypothetical protein